MFFISAYAMFDGVNTTRNIEKNCIEEHLKKEILDKDIEFGQKNRS